MTNKEFARRMRAQNDAAAKPPSQSTAPSIFDALDGAGKMIVKRAR